VLKNMIEKDIKSP